MSNNTLSDDIHYKDRYIFGNKCFLQKNICIFTD